jgi:VIT1/CCC1 family predicted Fe2+/Mn2+ transporter
MRESKPTPIWKFILSILLVLLIMFVTDYLNEGSMIKETLKMLGIIMGLIIVVSGFVHLMKKFFF